MIDLRCFLDIYINNENIKYFHNTSFKFKNINYFNNQKSRSLLIRTETLRLLLSGILPIKLLIHFILSMKNLNRFHTFMRNNKLTFYYFPVLNLIINIFNFRLFL